MISTALQPFDDHIHYDRSVVGFALRPKQAVREAAQYAPAPIRCTLQPNSSPYTSYACGAQRPCAMNIRDRQAAARTGRRRRL